MSVIRSQPYTRQGRDNWADIFEKKPCGCPAGEPGQPGEPGIPECGPDEIADGFGSVWKKKCPTCQQDTMEVVRPGKVQCTNCG